LKRFQWFLIVFMGFFLQNMKLEAQQLTRQLTIPIRVVFVGQKVALDLGMSIGKSDTLTISTLKWYLGNFVFLKKGKQVFTSKDHHLLNLEDANTLKLIFQVPSKLRFDAVQFDLGVDSVTQTSGAMGGDLDPTHGMFWTWQSGYIHAKIEGNFTKSQAYTGAFEFHLGGYAAPFATVQSVTLKTGRISKHSDLELKLDLAPFFERVNLKEKPGIMSPSAEAVRLSAVLAKSFGVHEK
jgi:hypothetical protein